MQLQPLHLQLTKLCHSDDNIPPAPFQLLMEYRNYLAKILNSEQPMQLVDSPESLTSVSASARNMDEFGSSLCASCHFKGDTHAASLELPLRLSFGSSENSSIFRSPRRSFHRLPLFLCRPLQFPPRRLVQIWLARPYFQLYSSTST
jgi:hypothetical protein